MLSQSIINTISKSIIKSKNNKIISKKHYSLSYTNLRWKYFMQSNLNFIIKSIRLKMDIYDVKNNEINESMQNKILNGDLKYLNNIYNFFVNDKHKTEIFEPKYGLLNYDHYLELKKNIKLLTNEQQIIFETINLYDFDQKHDIKISYYYFCNFVDNLTTCHLEEMSYFLHNKHTLKIELIKKYQHIFTPEELANFNNHLNSFDNCLNYFDYCHIDGKYYYEHY